jgi:hypothetical protein
MSYFNLRSAFYLYLLYKFIYPLWIMPTKDQIAIYQTKDGNTSIEVKLENDYILLKKNLLNVSRQTETDQRITSEICINLEN